MPQSEGRGQAAKLIRRLEESATRRFYREAWITARLSHPDVPMPYRAANDEVIEQAAGEAGGQPADGRRGGGTGGESLGEGS